MKHHFDVYITHVEMQEQRIYHEDYDRLSEELDRDEPPEGVSIEQDLNAHLFIWLEGNFSCDCNLALFFARAKSNDPLEWVDCVCGNELYKIDKIVIRETGRIVWNN